VAAEVKIGMEKITLEEPTAGCLRAGPESGVGEVLVTLTSFAAKRKVPPLLAKTDVLQDVLEVLPLRLVLQIRPVLVKAESLIGRWG
jgi:hypothetical protein